MMSKRQQAFSLVEMLVVLAILAVSAAVLLPNLGAMYRAYKTSTDWADIRDQLNGLGVRAWLEGNAYQLASSNPAPGVPLFALDLPSNWQYQTTRPIYFQSNGVCRGGELRIFFNEQLFRTVQLSGPHCQVPA